MRKASDFFFRTRGGRVLGTLLIFASLLAILAACSPYTGSTPAGGDIKSTPASSISIQAQQATPATNQSQAAFPVLGNSLRTVQTATIAGNKNLIQDSVNKSVWHFSYDQPGIGTVRGLLYFGQGADGAQRLINISVTLGIISGYCASFWPPDMPANPPEVASWTQKLHQPVYHSKWLLVKFSSWPIAPGDFTMQETPGKGCTTNLGGNA